MALLSEGRNMWVIGELSMFYAGAINVPLSIKLEESNDLLFRLEHAMVKFIMVSKQQLGKIRLIIDKLPLVEKVIVLDQIETYREKECYVGDVMEMGKEFLASHTPDEFLSVARSIQNDDYATITYT